MVKKRVIKEADCCDPVENPADHIQEIHRISRISGQLEGVKKMVSNREYCPKILTQLQAVRAALKSLEAAILEKHLQVCVNEAIRSKNQKDVDGKMQELMELYRRA